MPKAYSDEEKAYIKDKLKETALECMIQYGIKKTTVDEMVKRAHIPKGTFYLFYQSKEILLFDAILDLHERFNRTLKERASKLPGHVTAEEITELLFDFYMMADQEGLIAILQGGEMELLMRRLPQEVLQTHYHTDEVSVKEIVKLIPGMGDKDISAYDGAFRAVFLAMVFKEQIGGETFGQSLKLLIRGLVIQLMER